MSCKFCADPEHEADACQHHLAAGAPLTALVGPAAILEAAMLWELEKASDEQLQAVAVLATHATRDNMPSCLFIVRDTLAARARRLLATRTLERVTSRQRAGDVWRG